MAQVVHPVAQARADLAVDVADGPGGALVMRSWSENLQGYFELHNSSTTTLEVTISHDGKVVDTAKLQGGAVLHVKPAPN